MNENTIFGFEESKQFIPAESMADAAAGIEYRRQGRRGFKFKTVDSESRRTAANGLVKKMYSWRGYEVDKVVERRRGELVLMAETGGEVAATMTVCLDGEGGLPADENFSDVLESLRMDGCSLWEPCRVAVVNHTPKRVFAGLMHLAFMYAGILRSCTDAVIEVNPRHVRFYSEMLGFKALSEPRRCSRVEAPGVLLHLNMRSAQERSLKDRQSVNKKDRTFYPYFFRNQDAADILNRLSIDFSSLHHD